MKNSIIITGLILFVLLGVNIYLLDKKCKITEQENMFLRKEYGNTVEMCKMMEALNTDNLSQSYKNIIIKENVNINFLNKLDTNNSKLIIRFDVHSCATCVNSLKAFIKSISKEIELKNILLLPTSENDKTSNILKMEFKEFDILNVPKNDFYVLGTENFSEPYMFIYNKSYTYPLLFFYYRAEFSELNNRYYRSIIEYFNYKLNENE